MNTQDRQAQDALLIALAELMGKNIPMRDAFLAEQTPEIREQYWGEIAEAHERLGL